MEEKSITSNMEFKPFYYCSVEKILVKDTGLEIFYRRNDAENEEIKFEDILGVSIQPKYDGGAYAEDIILRTKNKEAVTIKNFKEDDTKSFVEMIKRNTNIMHAKKLPLMFGLLLLGIEPIYIPKWVKILISTIVVFIGVAFSWILLGLPLSGLFLKLLIITFPLLLIIIFSLLLSTGFQQVDFKNLFRKKNKKQSILYVFCFFAISIVIFTLTNIANSCVALGNIGNAYYCQIANVISIPVLWIETFISDITPGVSNSGFILLEASVSFSLLILIIFYAVVKKMRHDL